MTPIDHVLQICTVTFDKTVHTAEHGWVILDANRIKIDTNWQFL